MAKKAPSTAVIKPRQNTPLLILMLLIFPCYGGYYHFVTFAAGIILAGILCYETWQGRIPLPRNRSALLLCGMVICSLTSFASAISVGGTLSGFFRLVVWLLFYWCAASYSRDERELMKNALAREGVILALCSIGFFVYQGLHNLENANGRIDGFFEYANAYALYLLVCLLMLISAQEEKLWVKIGGSAVLVLAIFLTGSRGVLFLTVGYLLAGSVMVAIKRKKARYAVVLFVALGMLFGVAALLSSGLLLQRITSLFSGSSSVNGRLLYWKDAISILKDYPLGIGRDGYLYLQPLYQTGVYTLKFVHNEFLQQALDGGILSGILLLIFPLFSLFSRETSLRDKLVLSAIWIHCLVDFDLQFTGIAFLLLLCCDMTKPMRIPLPKAVPAGITTVLALVLGYGAVSYYFDYAGDAKMAYAMLPTDLVVAESRLQNCSDMLEAEKIADDILADTELSMLAWDCKFTVAAQSYNSMEMVRCRYQYLLLNPYRGEVYEEFAALLQNVCNDASPEAPTEYQAMAQSVCNRLEEVHQNTSELAYRIADKPDWGFYESTLQSLTEVCEWK